jgi:hypothetical protein
LRTLQARSSYQKWKSLAIRPLDVQALGAADEPNPAALSHEAAAAIWQVQRAMREDALAANVGSQGRSSSCGGLHRAGSSQ